MDYTIDHAINHAVRAHPLLDAVLAGFASWGVTLFGVAAFALWLFDRPRETGIYRRACAAGLSAAAVGLLINQVVSHVWHRARPYETHPQGIIPLISRSHDPSFPSDHATAAFAIAFGILFVAYRAGLVFLVWATLIAVSRVLVGVHYPTDVLAGLGIGLVAGFVCARLLMAPVLVIVSAFTAHPMNLVFSSPLELIAIAAIAFAVNAVAQDGETTWFEGVQLLAVYGMVAIGAFFLV